MAQILYDHGKKIGEISSWSLEFQEPVYKNVLGKIVLSTPANNVCTFVSPKPVNRKSKLSIIQDAELEYVLQLKMIKGGTFVTAVVISKNNLQLKTQK